MRLTIIGAGPAGLYLGIKAKQLDPSHQVRIFEKGKKDAGNGLGYVLQGPIVAQLAEIDPAVEESLSPLITEPWKKVELEAKGIISGRVFPTSVGIQRSSLVDYLRALAERQGIEIIYGRYIRGDDIEFYRKREADVVVGADGIYSMLRDAYPTRFGVSEINGLNSYLWLAKTNREPNMKVKVQQHRDVTLVGTSYPIDADLDAMIVEASTDKLRQSGLLSKTNEDGTISTSGLRELQIAFLTLTSEVCLRSVHSKWIPNKLNSCERLVWENLALVGEAGISTHYSIGCGLLVAFRAAGELAQQLASPCNPVVSLQSYNDAMLDWLHNAQQESLQSMRWLERVDTFYNSLDGDQFLDAFGKKSPL